MLVLKILMSYFETLTSKLSIKIIFKQEKVIRKSWKYYHKLVEKTNSNLI